MLRTCLAAIETICSPGAVEVIVVDNASTDDSVAMVRQAFPRVRLIVQEHNAGFGVANNAGVAATQADTILLLNSDAILLEDTPAGLAHYLAEHPAVCCVGPRIILPNGARQPRVYGNQPTLWRIAMQTFYLGLLFPHSRLFEGTDGSPRPGPEDRVGWISGVCMAMRRVDFLAAGGFDPAIFMYGEDVDLCGRLAQGGGAIIRLDRLAVLHHGGASSPTMTSQIRNSVWVQRNMLMVMRRRSGRLTLAVARLLLALGLLCRVTAGLAAIPRRGVGGNLLLQASLARLRDLIAISRP